jgi:choline dehydrogenase
MPYTAEGPGDRPDIVIVGGGSAGAALAGRLTEDSARSVLLLEGGRVYAPSDEPEDLRDPGHVPGNPEHDWGYTARGTASAPEIIAPRGKGLGGSSAVNAAIAMRPRWSDIREWHRHGVDGWSVEEVEAAFTTLEGTFPIRQRRYEDLTPSLRAFVDACAEKGFRRIDDFNTTPAQGVGGDPVNIVDGVRQHTGRVYLTDEVRARPNLTIRGEVLVDRIEFDGHAATGVVTADGTVVAADEVILSAGAYGSAAILLRSGVGPTAELGRHDIDVVADLPVGEHLQDHPFFYNPYALSPDALDSSPRTGALLWTASSAARDGELDLHVSATHLMDPSLSPTGGAIVLATAVVQPDSRGTLRLRSRDPEDPPLIDCNFFAEPRDRARMLEGVKLGRAIGRHPAFAPLVATELFPGDAVSDDEELTQAIESNIASYGHPVATAPMGGPDHPWAVVDARGAVNGLTRLRVVDASILPAVPSVATNLTTIMVAERIAQVVYGR